MRTARLDHGESPISEGQSCSSVRRGDPVSTYTVEASPQTRALLGSFLPAVAAIEAQLDVLRSSVVQSALAFYFAAHPEVAAKLSIDPELLVEARKQFASAVDAEIARRNGGAA